MHSQSKRFAVAIVVLLWLVSSPAPVSGRQSAGGGGSGAAAVATARAFYTAHLSGGTTLLKGKKKWLMPELYRLISTEERKNTSPDEVGYFDGDPWTDSQDPPTSFRIGKADVSTETATVEIVFRWFDRKKLVEERTCRLKLEKDDGRWLISDIISHEGESLLDELRKRNKSK